MDSGMPAHKVGDLAAVSANRHGTPAAAMRTRLIVEEEAALGIGAKSERCLRTLGHKFRRRAGNPSEQPIEAAFASGEFHAPSALFEDQFVLPFRDSKDVVCRLDPIP